MRAHFLRSSKPPKFPIKIQINRITTVQKLQVIAKSHHTPLNCSQHCMQCCLPNLRQRAFSYDLACLFLFAAIRLSGGPFIRLRHSCHVVCVCVCVLYTFLRLLPFFFFVYYLRRRKGRTTRKIATFMDFPRSIRFATLLAAPHAPLLTRRFME